MSQPISFTSLGLGTTGKKKAQTQELGFPALTIFAAPTEEKKEWGFNLNEAAVELLGGAGKVTFSADGQALKEATNVSTLYILKADGLPEEVASLNVRGNGNFASKPFHQTITEKLNLDATQDNVFRLALIPNEEGYVAASLTLNVEQETVSEEVRPEEAEAPEPVMEEVREEAW